MVNRAVVRSDFISLNIFVDKDVDQLLSIMGTSGIKTGADLTAGSALMGSTNMSCSIIGFLWRALVFITQRRQRIANRKR